MLIGIPFDTLVAGAVAAAAPEVKKVESRGCTCHSGAGMAIGIGDDDNTSGAQLSGRAGARLLTGLAMAAGLVLSAHATPVVAGRAKTELPDDQRWEVQAFASPDIRINEGNFTMPSQTQVLRLVSGSNRTDAILIMIGNVGGQIGNVSWGSNCPKQATSTGLFVLNRSTEYKDNCLLVLGPVEIDALLQRVAPEVAKAMREKESLFDAGGYFVRATYASGATRLWIDAFLRQDFAGSTTSLPTGEATGGIPAEVVQWGNALIDEVKGSVHSITGRFQIPRLEFLGHERP